MLDLKRLRYLDAVYRYKNFTRASEELFVSQPAISAAISSLEKEAGVTFIVRNSKKVIFTMEGEQFMFHVSRILKECDSAERLICSLSDAGERTLHLGMSPTLSHKLLPYLYSHFFPLWPDAKIYINEASMRTHIQKLNDEIIDLAYNALPPNAEELELKTVPIITAQIYALMNPKHPLAKYDRIPIEALEGQSVCLLDDKSQIRALMLKKCEEAGVTPNVVSYHEQISCMYHMVDFGGYIGFCNADPHDPGMFGSAGLAARPFVDPISFEAGFIMKKSTHLPKIAIDLINFTKNSVDILAQHF